MTVIMEFRLPALTTDKNGQIRRRRYLRLCCWTDRRDAWRQGRKLWAQVWEDLSSTKLTAGARLAKLKKISSWFAVGEHHLSIRTGEQVRDADNNNQLTNEFEYREYYINATGNYSTRKLCREPFACAAKSDWTFEQRIDSEWVPPDMAWNYMSTAELGDDDVADLRRTAARPATNCPTDNRVTTTATAAARSFARSSLVFSLRRVAEGWDHRAAGPCLRDRLVHRVPRRRDSNHRLPDRADAGRHGRGVVAVLERTAEQRQSSWSAVQLRRAVATRGFYSLTSRTATTTTIRYCRTSPATTRRPARFPRGTLRDTRRSCRRCSGPSAVRSLVSSHRWRTRTRSDHRPSYR